MTRERILVVLGLVVVLTLVATAQPSEPREGSPPPTAIMPMSPQGPLGPGPVPALALREYAEQLRARARQAQELADWLRRQADEVDQMAMRQMERGPGAPALGPVQRELQELREAIGRAEREGRRDEAAELRQRADQLRGQLRPMSPDERMAMRQEMKRQVERLRDQARQAKEQGRLEQSEQIWKEADRLEQKLREQGAPDEQRQAIKEKIERLRDESRKAKDQGRLDEADRLWKEADRLEQQLRAPGQSRKPVPPEVQDILRSAEQAEREGRLEDARRQREKAEAVARQLQGQARKGGDPSAPKLKDELLRNVEEIRKEIGRLWQAVNEMRRRPAEGRPA
jgi:hypothetical protein